MLVLSRLVNEVILIGEPPDQIKLLVIEIDAPRGRVRLGIEAPRNVPITRPDARSQEKKERPT